MTIWQAVIFTAILAAPLGYLIGARLPRWKLDELERENASLLAENERLCCARERR